MQESMSQGHNGNMAKNKGNWAIYIWVQLVGKVNDRKYWMHKITTVTRLYKLSITVLYTIQFSIKYLHGHSTHWMICMFLRQFHCLDNNQKTIII